MKTSIFTLFYSSTFNTVSNAIPVIWPSKVGSSIAFPFFGMLISINN